MSVPRDIFPGRAAERLIPMGDLLAFQADRAPARAALTFADRTWTRAELQIAAARRTTRLASLGLAPGDRVVVTLSAGPEFHISCFATWALGATPVPLAARQSSAELTALVELADCRLVIGTEEGEIAGRRVVTVSWDEDLALQPARGPSLVADHWKVIGSGGSTGRPKLIVDARPAAFDPEVTSLGIEVDDVILCPAPVYHNAPFSITNWGMAWGGHVIEVTRFDPIDTLRLVEKHKVRWLYLVPTMMGRIWALPEEVRTAYDLSSLEAVVHMAAPCPAWLKRNWIEWLGADRILEIYAGTEAVGACTISGSEWLAHPGSVGRPLLPDSIRILDEDRQSVDHGVIGAVHFRRREGARAGFRYVGSSQPDNEGWETYGDMGSLDAEGYLYLADRRTDMFVCGGANIWPAEIEAALEEIEGIRSAVVVGMPDDDLGQVGHAIIEPEPGYSAPDPGTLRNSLVSRLASSKLPRTFEIAQGPLRDEAGKVRRTALRDERIERLRAGEKFATFETPARSVQAR